MNKNNDEQIIPFPIGEEVAKRIEATSRELNDSEHALIDEYKESLWNRVNELMMSGDYTSQDDFNFKLSAWVQHLCVVSPASHRQLIFQASDEIQRRFYMVLSAGVKAGLAEKEKASDE